MINKRGIVSVLGINVRQIMAVRYLVRYFNNLRSWKQAGGNVSKYFPILEDYAESAGTNKGHYFHQDLLVAQKIFAHNPTKHVDVGSRIDGFVAHVASYRKIEIHDVRPLMNTGHKNILFHQTDFTADVASSVTDSISCLHALEHFGLGRYGEPISPNGHIAGLTNLISMLQVGGRLYLSVPLASSARIEFNAHRVFEIDDILELPVVTKNLKLVEFDFVNDDGHLIENQNVFSLPHTTYGCGIFTFEKINNE